MSDKLLRISDELAFPLDAVTQTFSILAKRRVGKSYTASKMAEEFVAAQLPFVVLDPTNAWWGLRSSADGKKPGLPVVILGGAHGDLPLEPTAGKVIADLVVDHPGFYVLDLSGTESNAAQDRFAMDFAERLYRRKEKSRFPMHLFVDEADSFAPQRPMPGQQRMLGAFEALVRRGGIRGVGVTLITQRPAVLNKNVLTQTEVLIALQTTAPQDQDAIDDWVKRNGTPEKRAELMSSLASLQKGEAWIWSPAWLQEFKRVRIRKKWTFDSGKTPEVGEKAVEPKKLAPVDLQKLGKEIQATVERAKENDPGELRKRIVALERELAAAKKETPAPAVAPEPIEVPVLAKGDLEEFKLVVGGIEAALDNTSRSLKDSLNSFLQKISLFPHSAEDQRRPQRLPIMSARPLERPKVAPAPAKAPKQDRAKAELPTGDFAPSKPQREIMAILGTYGSCSKRKLAIRAVYSIDGGGFNNAIYGLRARGLIQGDDPFELTPEGARLVNALELSYRPPAPGQLEARWVQEKLSKAEAEILEVLCKAAGPISVEEIAAATPSGYVATGGGFMNAVYHLRSLGLIEGEKNALQIVEDFFP
jgi:hypothetical protein